jgi:hypothetical protein
MKISKVMMPFHGVNIEIGKVIFNKRGWVYKGNGKKASSKFFKTPEEAAKLCRVKHTLEEIPEPVKVEPEAVLLAEAVPA